MHTLGHALRIPAEVSVFAKCCSSEVTDLCYLTALIAVTPNSHRSNKINKCAHFLSLCAVFSLLREIVFQHGVTEAYVTDGSAHRACAYFTYCFCVKSFAEQALTMDFLCTKGLPCSQIKCVQPQAWPSASINSLTSFWVSTQCWQLCFRWGFLCSFQFQFQPYRRDRYNFQLHLHLTTESPNQNQNACKANAQAERRQKIPRCYHATPCFVCGWKDEPKVLRFHQLQLDIKIHTTAAQTNLAPIVLASLPHASLWSL